MSTYSLSKITVKETLGQSNAQAESVCDLNQHFAYAVWTNQNDKVHYHQVNHHTLSLYLEGGYSTQRADQRYAGTGAPGKFCIFPAGQSSDWEVGERMRFAHIYFSDSILRHIALQDFDIDPRLVELPDKTFFNDSLLLSRYQDLMTRCWSSPEQRLALQEGMWQILGDLVTRYAIKPTTKNHYRGGLTKAIIAKVTEYIDAHIEKQITIEDLAHLANMSPFHFTRMYKTSTGLNPHQTVICMRIKKASQMLLENNTQLDTSIACGFANQSHFSRAFRKHYGITPKQYLHARCKA